LSPNPAEMRTKTTALGANQRRNATRLRTALRAAAAGTLSAAKLAALINVKPARAGVLLQEWAGLTWFRGARSGHRITEAGRRRLAELESGCG
jgi:hypothetical protein